MTFEVICDLLLVDGLDDTIDDQVTGLLPSHVFEHHNARKDDRRRVDDILAGIFRGSAMGRFEDRGIVADVCSGSHAEPSDLGRACIREIIAVQVWRGEHIIFVRTEQDLLEHRVGDTVVDQNPAFRHLTVVILPEFVLGHDLVAKLISGQIVTPVTERALRVLHNVSLVNQCHGLAIVFDRIIDGATDQIACGGNRNRLDSDAGIPFDLEPEVAQEIDQFECAISSFLKFDSRIHIFGVFAEDHDIQFFGMFDGSGNSVEVANRTDAGIEIEHLAERHVERSDSTSDGRRQRPLDRNDEMLDRIERAFRQPFAELLVRLFTGEDFIPYDATLSVIGLGHGRIKNSD